MLAVSATVMVGARRGRGRTCAFGRGVCHGGCGGEETSRQPRVLAHELLGVYRLRSMLSPTSITRTPPWAPSP